MDNKELIAKSLRTLKGCMNGRSRGWGRTRRVEGGGTGRPGTAAKFTGLHELVCAGTYVKLLRENSSTAIPIQEESTRKVSNIY